MAHATLQFMQERYNEVCEQVLSYRDHRENLVRRAVIELIPTLASYNHQEFIGSYLHRCMIYLLGQLKKERDRTTCGCRTPLPCTEVCVQSGSQQGPWLLILSSIPCHRTCCAGGDKLDVTISGSGPGKHQGGSVRSRVSERRAIAALCPVVRHVVWRAKSDPG